MKHIYLQLYISYRNTDKVEVYNYNILESFLLIKKQYEMGDYLTEEEIKNRTKIFFQTKFKKEKIKDILHIVVCKKYLDNTKQYFVFNDLLN